MKSFFFFNFIVVVQVIVVFQLLLVTNNNTGERRGGTGGGGGGIIVVQAQEVQEEATIADKWRIGTDVDVDYWNYVFDFTYSVSNFIDVGQAGFYIYSKECRSGGGSIQSIGFDTSLTIAENGQDVIPGSEIDVNKINMSKSVTVPVTVNEFTMQDNTDIYTDFGNKQMKVEFCIVFYLNTVDGTLEVNQQETLVTIDIDLTELIAQFRVDAFDVGTKDRNQDTTDIIYSPVAYLCNVNDGSDYVVTSTFTQGDMINVCVKPNQSAITDSIKINSIESLTFSRDGSSLNQNAVLNSIASTNGLSTYNDIDCYGQDYCSVSTILISSFFTTPGTVSGNGEASLTFYSAAQDAERRKKERNLLIASSNNDLIETTTINENNEEDAIINNNNNNNNNNSNNAAAGAAADVTTTFLYNSDHYNHHHRRSLQDNNNNNNNVDGAIPSFVMDLNVIPADDSPTMFTPTSSASPSALALALATRRRPGSSNHDYFLIITHVVPSMIIMIMVTTTVGLLLIS